MVDEKSAATATTSMDRLYIFFTDESLFWESHRADLEKHLHNKKVVRFMSRTTWLSEQTFLFGLFAPQTSAGGVDFELLAR